MAGLTTIQAGESGAFRHMAAQAGAFAVQTVQGQIVTFAGTARHVGIGMTGWGVGAGQKHVPLGRHLVVAGQAIESHVPVMPENYMHAAAAAVVKQGGRGDGRLDFFKGAGFGEYDREAQNRCKQNTKQACFHNGLL
jgi:hypothetical protein